MPDRFEIIYDPEECFTPGATFNTSHFTATLAASCWPRGLIILDLTTGIKYRVTQCLIPMEPGFPPLIPNTGRTVHVIPSLKQVEEIAQ